MSFGSLFKKIFGGGKTTTSDEVTTEPVVSNSGPDLSGLKMADLREIAKSRGLKGWTKMRKSELVEFLNS